VATASPGTFVAPSGHRPHRYPDTFRAELLDMTETQAMHNVVDRSFADSGRIDVIVSNVGLFTLKQALGTALREHGA
jgi:NADP-dependent 3-hydroxy acid dehydrogenase YdfG